ncbi:MAG TPA: rhodanese-like domain-containing protein [Vicinamibacteria bacterium]|nr:rhodanese-like domain-containing protein [Vicinamibacteria bacterium]
MIERCGPLLLVLATAGCIVWPAGSGPGAAPIAAAEALARSERGEAVIVDVRPREAYEAGHVPGALHIEALEVEARAAEIRRLGRLPILYCG